MPDARTRALVVTSLALFLSVLVWFNYSAVLPLIVEEWGLSGTRAGIIFGAFQAGYLLSIIPMGWLADRSSPRWVVSAGATGTGLFSLGFAVLATDFVSGSLLRLLAGLCMAGVYVPGMRFVSDWYPPAARGRALGIYIGTFSLGSGLSFLAAGAIADALDWRIAIAVTSVGALAVAPLVLGLTRDRPGEADPDPVERHGEPMVDAGDEDGIEPSEAGFRDALLGNRAYLSAVSVYAWHNWELFGMRNWLLAFLVATPAMAATGSTALAGVIVGVTMTMSGVGNLLGGWASDRVGRTRTIAAALAASAAISAALGLLGWLPLWILVAVLLLYGVVISVDSAPTSTLITEVVDDRHVGTALSVQSFVGFATTVVSPVVFGIALDTAGWGPAFATLAAGALIGLASALVLHRSLHGTST